MYKPTIIRELPPYHPDLTIRKLKPTDGACAIHRIKVGQKMLGDYYVYESSDLFVFSDRASLTTGDIRQIRCQVRGMLR